MLIKIIYSRKPDRFLLFKRLKKNTMRNAIVSLLLLMCISGINNLHAQVKPCPENGKWVLCNGINVINRNSVYDTIIEVFKNSGAGVKPVAFYIAYEGDFVSKDLAEITTAFDETGQEVEVQNVRTLRYFNKGKIDLFDRHGKLLQSSITRISLRLSLMINGEDYGLSYDARLFDSSFYLAKDEILMLDSTAPVLIKKSKGWGAINMQGNVVLPFKHELIEYRTGDIGNFLVSFSKEKKITLYNEKGKRILREKYEEIGDFWGPNDSAGNLIKEQAIALVKLNNKTGIIDFAFRAIKAPLYDTIFHIYSEHIIAKNERPLLFGYKGGKILYTTFPGGTSQTEEHDSGTGPYEIKAEDIIMPCFSGGTVEVFDYSGNVIIKDAEQIAYRYTRYSGMLTFNFFEPLKKEMYDQYHLPDRGFPPLANSLLPILMRVKGKWGGINMNGQTVIPFQYDTILWLPSDSIQNYVFIAKNIETKLYTIDGQVIYTGNIDSVIYHVFDKEQAREPVYKINGKYYRSEKMAGKTAIELRLIPDSLTKPLIIKIIILIDEIYYEFEDRFVLDNLLGDYWNRNVFYNSLLQTSDGYIATMQDSLGNERYGLLDSSGNIMIPFDYNEIAKYGDNYVNLSDTKLEIFKVLKSDHDSERFGLIDSRGRIVLPVEQSSIQRIASTNLAMVKTAVRSMLYDAYAGKYYEGLESANYLKGLLVVVNQSDSKYGILNKDLEIITPLIYDNIINTGIDYVFLVKKGELWGGIALDGKLVIPIIHEHISEQDNHLVGKAGGKAITYNAFGEIIPVREVK
jgi:hypothetical protein